MMVKAEKHAAEPLAAEPSSFELETDTEKWKRYKSPNHQIPSELIQARCLRYIKLISIWNKGEFPEQWKELIIVQSDITGCSNFPGISL